MKTKSYKVKSSVRRAAKQLGMNLDTLEYFQDENGDWFGQDEGVNDDLKQPAADIPEENDCRQEMVYNEAGDAVPAVTQKADEQPAEVKAPTQAEHFKNSTIPNPCKTVWEICEQNKGARRGEVLNACVNAGVAYNTARTQYQQWLVASRGETK